ncbi:hypothetical protein VTN77DRAFT_114 [Rasamsonia byssochlamydoides]|uniref:uncharacterized protein n=1 Tax=Rasamsonia byssochlamydoides TaxID=89139 RepID=UPI003743E28C
MDGNGSRLPRSQKLKDTCDLCSASKVRCSKEKPVCGRCEKYGYPCFYSPARRMGRPHPPRTVSHNNSKPGSEAESPEAQGQLIRSRSRSDTGSSGEIPRSTRELSGHNNLHAKSINGRLQGENNNDNDFSFRPSVPQNMTMNFPTTFIPRESPREDSLEEADAGRFNFDDGLSRVSSNEIDGSFFQDDPIPAMLLPSPSTSNPFGSTSSSSSSSSISSLGQLSGLLALSQASGAAKDDTESDCATVAMHLLQKLNIMTSRKTAPQPLDSLLSTVAASIKRISTILVCPCSSKTEVGLLAAAVCAAVLDIYAIVFRSPAGSEIHTCIITPPSSATDSQPPAYTTLFSIDGSGGDRMEISIDPDESKNTSKETTVRVLEEMPKVANLVMQFARRYSGSAPGDEGGCSADYFLPALAASLKARLRAMTDEATSHWLAQV